MEDEDGIADLIISGIQCSWCGVIFEHAHGHLVLCKSCFEDQRNGKVSTDIPKATHKEIGDD